MNGSLSADEIERLDKVMCTVHSEVVFVAGMPVADLIAWTRGHQTCELTVVLHPEGQGYDDIARLLADYEEGQ